MKWFKRLTQAVKTASEDEPVTRGLLVFSHPTIVISVEEILLYEGYTIRIVTPPPAYRTGCDLSIEFPFEAEAAIIELLDSIGIVPLDVVPISSQGMEPIKFVRKKTFGKYLMIRCANMKISVHRETKIIVNISGGGCPDVPYLATEMIGKRLSEAPDPNEIGFSLCAYSLNTAREELIRTIGNNS